MPSQNQIPDGGWELLAESAATFDSFSADSHTTRRGIEGDGEMLMPPIPDHDMLF